MLRRVWSVVMFTVFWALPGLSAHAQQAYLDPAEALRLSVIRQPDDQVRLTWEISKGYYLYRKQMKVEAEPAGSTGSIDWPAGVVKTDETFGESEVYHDQVSVLVKAPEAQALTVT